MRPFLCFVCALVIFSFGRPVLAEGEPATYQRQRGRQPQSGRGGRQMPGWQHPGYGWSSYWGGNFGHAYAGNWYQRPYPYHFDFYRGRFDGPPMGMNQPAYPGVQPTVAE